MSTRSGRVRASVIESSPPRTRKGVSPPRSPARTRKTSPTPNPKSSSAQKGSSPARSSRKSPSRKSPSRKPTSKFPARKSPSRVTKDTSENATQKSPTKRPAIKTDMLVRLEDMSSKMEMYRSTRSKRIEYSVKDVLSTTYNDNFTSFDKINGLDSKDVYGLRNRKSVEEMPPRRSSRLKDFMENVPDIRRSISKSLSKSVSKSVSQSIDTFSDEDNSTDELSEKSKLVTRKLATPLRGSESKLTLTSSKWEFGGRIGTGLLTVLIPLTVFSVLISCMMSCSPKVLLNLTAFSTFRSWFSVSALTLVISQYVLQALIAVTPLFGKKVDRLDGTGMKCHFNATFASFIAVNLVFLLDYLKIVSIETLLTDYVKLAAASYLFSVLLSIVLYVKSNKVDDSQLNYYGNTGYASYDFFMGREIHPFIKNLDVKVWISRVSNVNALILTAFIFKQGYKLQNLRIEDMSYDVLSDLPNKLQIQPTVLLFSTFQLTYILNFILKEHKVTTTFFWQSEGIGYLQTVSSALYPFYFTIISKFVADNQLVLSTNILISASVLYVLGFFIMLISNNIKHEFRNNPLHPSVTNLDSMPTFHGKKLLVANLWAVLRHPNYTGDILIHIALALPGLVSQQYMAAAPALLTILMLLHRAWRDHARCNRRYGAAWSRYCKRVPSVIIPKVL